MKILFITSLFFSSPPKDGSSVRTFNLIKHLSAENEIVLVSFKENKDQLEDVSQLKKYCRQLISVDSERRRGLANYLLNLFSFKPFFIWRKYHKEALKIVEEIFEQTEFDLIHVDGLGAAQFVLPYTNIPKIMDARDALWPFHQRQMNDEKNTLLKVYYWMKLLRLRKYELKTYSEFDRVVFISEVDEKRILSLSKGKLKNLTTIPFGVDLPQIKPHKSGSDFPSLIFTGNMPYSPNVDAILHFCKDIFPIVKEEFPDLRLYVVGRNPGPDIRELSRESDIIVTGEVEDMKVWLAKSTLFVCPLRYGSGMKIKILEAMAMCKPIVATSVAVEGIKIKNGENIIIADDSTSFALRTIELLKDEKLRNHIRENARKLVEKEYSWETASSKFNNLYSEAIDSNCKRNTSKIRSKEKIRQSLSRMAS